MVRFGAKKAFPSTSDGTIPWECATSEKEATELARLSITCVSRLRNAGEIEFLGFVIGEAFMNEAALALRTRHHYVLLAMQHLRGVASADDCRQPEFAADDGRLCDVRPP